MPDIPVTPPQLITTNTFGSFTYTVSGDGADTFASPDGTTSTNVKVYVGGLEVQSDDSNWSWSFDNDSGDVTFDSPPPNGESVTIERNVFLDFQNTGFPPGYILDARVLNRTFQSALYQGQELVETSDYTENKWNESALVPNPPDDTLTYLLVTEAGAWDPKLKTVVKGNIFDLANDDDVLFDNQVSCTGSVSSTNHTATAATFDVVSATNVSSTITKTFLGQVDDVRDLVINSDRAADKTIRSNDDENDGLSLDGSGVWLAPNAYYYPETVIDGQSTELETYPHTGLNVDVSGQLYAPLATRLVYNNQAGNYTPSFTKDKLNLNKQNVILGDTNGQNAKDNHAEPHGNIRANNVPDIIVSYRDAMDLKENVQVSIPFFDDYIINEYYGDNGGPSPLGGVKSTHNKLIDIRRITDIKSQFPVFGNGQSAITRPCYWMKFRHKISNSAVSHCHAQVKHTYQDGIGSNGILYVGSESRVFLGGSTGFNEVRDEWNAISAATGGQDLQIGLNPEYELIVYPDRNENSGYKLTVHASQNGTTPDYDYVSESLVLKIFLEEDHKDL